MSGIFSQLRVMFNALLRRNKSEDALAEEMQFHIDQQTEEHIAKGMPPEKARKEALKAFGGIEQHKEDCRDSWGTRLISEFLQDIRYGWRQVLKHKGFSLIVILTFAICLGLNTAIFNVYNSMVWNPNRFANEDRIISIWEEFDDLWGEDRFQSSRILWKERSEQSETLEAIGLFGGTWENITHGNSEKNAEFLGVGRMTPSMFEILKVAPLLGRTFSAEDVENEGNRPVLLGYEYWQNRYQGDENVIGSSLYINNQLHEVIGVMPEGFAFPLARVSNMPDQVYTPFPRWEWSWRPEFRNRPMGFCMGLMKTGVNIEQVEDELRRINVSNGLNYPEQFKIAQEQNHRTELCSLGDHIIRFLQTELQLLQMAVVFLLLLGCVNISSLIISHNHRRMGEFRYRYALGAGRFRLVRQLLTESVLVSIISAAIALCLSWLVLRSLEFGGIFDDMVIRPRVSLDRETWLFASCLALFLGTLVGFISLLPILGKAQDSSLADGLREDHRTASAGKSFKIFQGALIATQLCLAAVLLIGSGLLINSFTKILDIDTGFDSSNVFTAGFRPVGTADERREATEKFLEQAKQIAGVQDVAISNWPPLKLGNLYLRSLRIEGSEHGDEVMCHNDTVSAGYFATLGIRFLRGRTFSESEIQNRSPVVVIDKNLADLHFRGEDPVGKRISIPAEGGGIATEEGERNWLTIIGVTETIRNVNLLESPVLGTAFTHIHRQLPYWNGVMVRTTIRENNIYSELESMLASVTQKTGLAMPAMMHDLVDKHRAPSKALLIMCLIITFVSLLLSAVGIFGNVAYTVVLQTRELGIRMALGGSRLHVLILGIRFWFMMVLVGILCGSALSLGIAPYMESHLYNTSPRDLITYATAIIFLAVVSSLACYVSAYRIIRVNPMVALRAE